MKLIFLSWVCFAWGVSALHVLTSTHEPFIIFSLHFPAEDGEWKSSFDEHQVSSHSQHNTLAYFYLTQV